FASASGLPSSSPPSSSLFSFLGHGLD
ncbi:hypothetical protein A2U01_0077729, partial [Trifolium medium]|nr:hypothetical protein [Trifolium medium]